MYIIHKVLREHEGTLISVSNIVVLQAGRLMQIILSTCMAMHSV